VLIHADLRTQKEHVMSPGEEIIIGGVRKGSRLSIILEKRVVRQIKREGGKDQTASKSGRSEGAEGKGSIGEKKACKGHKSGLLRK